VSRAQVSVAGRQVAAIGPGMLVLLGVAAGDGIEQVDRIAARLLALRIFADAQGRMNEPLRDRQVLCVSQFTLCADTSRGNRPGFAAAASPEIARPLYERFCERTEAATGVFGAHMEVELVNDGPVTIMLET
jgi:D-tyrosyl-tRNA(Tyr) deacylase